MSSIPENLMAQQICDAGLPKPEREFVAIKGRRYRWDFAWIKHNLLLEIQGGVFIKGAHSTGLGIERDCEKMCLAAINGWQTMSFTTRQVKSGWAIEMLKAFFESVSSE